MNIKILDSWLREYLKTTATPKQIAERLSRSSVSVEKLKKYKNDYLYDIEITTNRPDLMSIIGIAREASAILPQFNIKAEFLQSPHKSQQINKKGAEKIIIQNDPKLVRRICAVIMEVAKKESPQYIKERLEATGIRSLNNLIDITNYVMRVTGHPTHVFDYDRLTSKKLVIRESKKGEKITTLDNKEYALPGGDIVADNSKGEIVDLLGIMGTANSVVTDTTKRILYFIDNVEPHHIRKTSMSLGVRTEAAVLNEKDIDPELAKEALIFGIDLYQKIADAKIISDIIDIYPKIPKKQSVSLSIEKINKIIGIDIPVEKSIQILESLQMKVSRNTKTLEVEIPSWRIKDIHIEEDLIEEIARVYGYHNIPNTLPPITIGSITNLDNNEFYWEKRVREALKYWGFTEVYTYSMVSKDLYKEETTNAVKIQNPLSEEFLYMRRVLTPSLLRIIKENQNHEDINIFEIAYAYKKVPSSLPSQTIHIAGAIKKANISFYLVKGFIEQLCQDIGINKLEFSASSEKNEKEKIKVYLAKESLGEIEIYDENTISFELNLELLLKNATLKKVYAPISKFPPIVEDLAIIAPENITTGSISDTIKKQSTLIKEVSLLDKFESTRTFHIIYQSYEKNLTKEEVEKIRNKILNALKEKFSARLKE
jgi:phenylalanyl-tRNA synthetase beta chain